MPRRPTSKDAPPASAPVDALPQDAAGAPEAAWFFAWFKSAMLYLAAVTAYLGAAAAVLAALRKLDPGGWTRTDITSYLVAGALALPLLFALLFNLLPALRRRRERTRRPVLDAEKPGAASYFTTSPRTGDPHGFFATGYEPFLKWAREPRSPLLHLTGLSGSGKSSLLSAYLTSRLESPANDADGPAAKVLIVRSYTDPLASLKDSLLALWKKPPPDYASLSPLEALRRAAQQLPAGERLLVAFDQFEEYFLLRAARPVTAPDESPSVSSTSSIPSVALTSLHDFLRAFLTDPPKRVALLLAYREDHRRLLEPLHLPKRQEAENWMTVAPLDFAAATRFLHRCPGLTIPEPRMDQVLREAASQEGGRVVMRPIVANLLGVVLRLMSGHPTLWRRTDLLRGYVRDCMGGEVTPERTRLLRATLTDFHTARPRTLTDIAREAKSDPATVQDHCHPRRTRPRRSPPHPPPLARPRRNGAGNQYVVHPASGAKA
ncbi:MAG TPA: hypothetical protein VG796_13880 [Verrucomicrobiales bacterium]|nr:hypothetical protein [Verrucomicrobiales bacterium]